MNSYIIEIKTNLEIPELSGAAAGIAELVNYDDEPFEVILRDAGSGAVADIWGQG